MNKLCIVMIPLLCLTVEIDELHSQTTQPTDEVSTVVEKIHNLYNIKANYQADFTQEMKRAIGRPFKSSGRIYFQKPGKMLWDYQTPEKVWYLSDGTNLWVIEFKNRQIQKFVVKGSKLYHSLSFLFGQGDLKQEYRVSLAATQPADRNQILIKLDPKVAQNLFKELQLQVDKTSGEISRAFITDPVGDTTAYSFINVTYNQVDSQRFNIDVDKLVSRGFSLHDHTRSAPQTKP